MGKYWIVSGESSGDGSFLLTERSGEGCEVGGRDNYVGKIGILTEPFQNILPIFKDKGLPSPGQTDEL
jgi:hypothetical protein